MFLSSLNVFIYMYSPVMRKFRSISRTILLTSLLLLDVSCSGFWKQQPLDMLANDARGMSNG